MGGLAAGAGLSSVGSEASGQLQEDPEEWPPADSSEAYVAALSGGQADVETESGGCAHLMPDEEGTLLVDIVLEDIECVTQAHIHEGDRGEDGPIVAPLLEYTEEVDGSGDGDPLTTRPDVPLIEGTVVDDPELVDAILADPEAYYVNVHTVHNPAGEVRGQIRGFDFGQETELEPVPAEFTVSGLDPDDIEVVRGEEIDVSARVRNEGDISDTQTVQLRIDDEVVAERELELGCRSSRRVRFEDIDTDDLDPDEYEHGVFTDDDSETGTLTVLRPAEFRVANLSPEDVTVTQGELIDVSARIRNVGDVSDTQTVEFRIDDETVADRRVKLDGRESRRITFEDIETDGLDPDEYEHGIFTEDDSETATLTVLSPPDFEVSELDPVDVTVTHGDLIDVSATVENVGGEAGTQTIEFRVDGDTIADQRLELDGGASETVEFEEIDTSVLEPGDYEHGVFTDDDSATGTLTVEAVPEANFVVTELDPEAETLDPGERLNLSATIENIGEEDGTQMVELRFDGGIIDDREVVLESGESESIDYEPIETDGLGPGEYEYGVFTDDDSATGTLTLEASDGADEDENGEEENGEGGNGEEENGEGGNGEEENGEGGNGEEENGEGGNGEEENGEGGNGEEENGEGGNGEEENGEGGNGEEENGETSAGDGTGGNQTSDEDGADRVI